MKQSQIDAQTRYQQRVKELSPNSPIFLNCLKAFVVGGLICCIGQGVHDFGAYVLRLNDDNASLLTSIFMVFLGAILTGLGIYDKIGKFAGAGSVVPITGFSNSVVSPAMEYRREGLVLGVGGKLFTVAGPVLVYGISTSILVGLLYMAIH